MSFAKASTWFGDSAKTSVPSCCRSCLSQRATALSPSGHDAANAAAGKTATATRAAAISLVRRGRLLVVVAVGGVGRRCIRDLGQNLRLVRQRSAAVTGRLLALATLGADAHGLALLGLGRSDDLDVDLALAVVRPADIGLGDLDRGARLHLGPQHRVGERVLDVALDRAAQRPGTHGRVESLLDQEVLRVVREVERELALRHRLPDAPQEEIDDRLDLVLLEL